MKRTFPFTFEGIKKQYQAALDAGYKFITCEEYYHYKKAGAVPSKIVVNRVDVDLSMQKADKLVNAFNELGVKGTFFIRLHAPEYNPFSFFAYNVVRHIVNTGHEIGYHSEVIDQATIWDEDPEVCLKRDIELFNKMYDVNIVGVASHGGMTGLNNLDFWKDKKASDYGLLYEAYDHEPNFNLFHESFYVSDSEWVRWKCYDKGKLVKGDNRSFEEHLADNRPLIHLLIHPDTYYESHIYDNEK
ncbi:MAG: hypothetical protein R2800_10780 [Flavipsychrobacter sp.]